VPTWQPQCAILPVRDILHNDESKTDTKPERYDFDMPYGGATLHPSCSCDETVKEAILFLKRVVSERTEEEKMKYEKICQRMMAVNE
jgi:hypothetical protein